MAATVTISELSGGRKSAQLDTRQAQMVLSELRRVRGGPFTRLVNELIAPRLRYVDIAPDLLITVQDGASTTEYEISGGWVLRRRGERAAYPFYMALLLIDWVYGRRP